MFEFLGRWRRQPAGAALPETKAITPGSFIAMHALSGPGWTQASFAALAREGYMRNPVVHRCVRMIAEAAAAVPWLVYDRDMEVPGHALASVIARPNPQQSQSDFLEAAYSDLLLAGAAWIERVDGGVGYTQLYLLRPETMRVETDEAGWPVSYVEETAGRKRIIPAETESGTNPVLQMRLYNPLDSTAGFAPLQSALMALDIHNAAADWNKALLDNSARPSGALVYAPADGGTLSPEQYEQLRRELDEGFSGTRQAGRPLLLEGGLDWKAMGLTPKDMDFIEAKNAASRDIALAFGVPPMLLGIPGDNTFANYQEAQRAFYRLTVLPLVRRTAQAFTRWLAEPEGSGLRYGFDLDAIEGLSSERDALWARVSGAGFLTEAEKRQAVGYSPEPARGEA